MKSMTGYGEAIVKGSNSQSLKAEIRSVNHRFFNLKSSLPQTLNIYEPDVGDLIKKHLRRGSINLVIREGKPESPELNIRAKLIKDYYRQLRQLQKTLKLKGDIAIESLISLPGVLEVTDKPGNNIRKQWLMVEKVLKSALRDLTAMREREGKRLAKALAGILNKMSGLLGKIARLAPQVRARYEQSLRQRLAGMLAAPDYNNIRQGVANEVALFAQRSDITEEIQRLKSHLEEFSRTMRQPGEAGKRLDFISQEMLREVNTMGTKANDSRITYNVIALKGNVEKLKEQVQNIE
jgi:uncharacterized protein (TIGR00255 family)